MLKVKPLKVTPSIAPLYLPLIVAMKDGNLRHQTADTACRHFPPFWLSIRHRWQQMRTRFSLKRLLCPGTFSRPRAISSKKIWKGQIDPQREVSSEHTTMECLAFKINSQYTYTLKFKLPTINGFQASSFYRRRWSLPTWALALCAPTEFISVVNLSCRASFRTLCWGTGTLDSKPSTMYFKVQVIRQVQSRVTYSTMLGQDPRWITEYLDKGRLDNWRLTIYLNSTSTEQQQQQGFTNLAQLQEKTCRWG